MRVITITGLLGILAAVAAGCGGDASSDDAVIPNPPGEGGEGGDGNGSGNEGGDGNGSGNEAGEGSGSGGTSAGGPSSGGMGQGASPAGGTSAGAGGGMPVPVPPGVGGSFPLPPPGMGGRPSTPPTNCKEQAVSSSAKDCYVEFVCDNTYAYTSCYDQGNGTWACSCSGSGAYASYVVSDVTGIAACNALSDICFSGEEPDYTGPEECSPILSSRSTSYCEIQEQCTRPLDIGDGNVASVGTTRGASCSVDSTGKSSCYCYNGPQYVADEGPMTACDSVLEYCGETPPVEFDGPLECVNERVSSGPSYCDGIQICTQSEEVADGIYAARREQRYASCQGVTGGGATCTCSSNTSSYQVDLDTDVVGAETCNQLSEACGNAEAIELDGPIECQVVSQSQSVGSCYSSIDCTQSGTLGELAVRGHGSLSASCQTDGTTWTCTCSNYTESVAVAVDSSTAWDACTAASEQCPELVEPVIGQGGIGWPGMPIPF